MCYPIPISEVELKPIRAQGPGGQNVNKVSSAAHLRFDVARSSLPDAVKQRLLALHDRRVGVDGAVVIKAQESRSWARNKERALARLREMVDTAARPPRVRKATKPTRASRRKRLEAKKQRSELKARRGRVDY